MISLRLVNGLNGWVVFLSALILFVESSLTLTENARISRGSWKKNDWSAKAGEIMREKWQKLKKIQDGRDSIPRMSFISPENVPINEESERTIADRRLGMMFAKTWPPPASLPRGRDAVLHDVGRVLVSRPVGKSNRERPDQLNYSVNETQKKWLAAQATPAYMKVDAINGPIHLTFQSQMKQENASQTFSRKLGCRTKSANLVDNEECDLDDRYYSHDKTNAGTVANEGKNEVTSDMPDLRCISQQALTNSFRANQLANLINRPLVNYKVKHTELSVVPARAFDTNYKVKHKEVSLVPGESKESPYNFQNKISKNACKDEVDEINNNIDEKNPYEYFDQIIKSKGKGFRSNIGLTSAKQKNTINRFLSFYDDFGDNEVYNAPATGKIPNENVEEIPLYQKCVKATTPLVKTDSYSTDFSDGQVNIFDKIANPLCSFLRLGDIATTTARHSFFSGDSWLLHKTDKPTSKSFKTPFSYIFPEHQDNSTLIMYVEVPVKNRLLYRNDMFSIPRQQAHINISQTALLESGGAVCPMCVLSQNDDSCFKTDRLSCVKDSKINFAKPLCYNCSHVVSGIELNLNQIDPVGCPKMPTDCVYVCIKIIPIFSWKPGVNPNIPLDQMMHSPFAKQNLNDDILTLVGEAISKHFSDPCLFSHIDKPATTISPHIDPPTVSITTQSPCTTEDIKDITCTPEPTEETSTPSDESTEEETSDNLEFHIPTRDLVKVIPYPVTQPAYCTAGMPSTSKRTSGTKKCKLYQVYNDNQCFPLFDYMTICPPLPVTVVTEEPSYVKEGEREYRFDIPATTTVKLVTIEIEDKLSPYLATDKFRCSQSTTTSGGSSTALLTCFVPDTTPKCRGILRGKAKNFFLP